MNSPHFNELSPSMSPIAFGFDDKTLLSPTKLKLDQHAPMNSLLYPTSLSKLSELSRTGRSQQRSRRDSDTLRSLSPLRLQFQNTGGANPGPNFSMGAPKMLKPEFLQKSSTSTSTLPLLSALLMKTGNGKAGSQQQGSASTENNSQTTSMSGFEQVSMIKESLDQLRQEVIVPKRNKNRDSTSTRRDRATTTKDETLAVSNDKDARKVSDANSEKTLYEEQHLRKQVPASHSKEVGSSRIFSTETATSAKDVDSQQLRDGLDVEALPTDRNGFVQIDHKNINTNRYSFISATSTDYDMEWYESQNNIAKHANSHRHGHLSSNRMMSVIQDDLRNQVNLESQSSQSSTSYEAQKLDLKIKQLELEISELKLQNEKLIHSITTNRIVEDRLLMDFIGNNENAPIAKPTQQRDMEKKVKQLEKRFDSYQKVLKQLKVISNSPPPKKSNSKHGHRHSHGHRKSCDNIQLTDNRGRILRISSTELRKLDEQQDSSSSSPSSFSDSPSSTSVIAEDEIEQIDLEDPTEEKITVKKRQNAASSVASATGSKKGFQLNFQVQLDDMEKIPKTPSPEL